MEDVKTLEDLGLSVRSYNNLRRASVDTIDDLLSLSYDELSSIHNLGNREVVEIRAKLMEAGLIKKNVEFKNGDMKVKDFTPYYDLIEFVNKIQYLHWKDFKENYSDKYIASVMDYDDSKTTSIILY